MTVGTREIFSSRNDSSRQSIRIPFINLRATPAITILLFLIISLLSVIYLSTELTKLPLPKPEETVGSNDNLPDGVISQATSSRDQPRPSNNPDKSEIDYSKFPEISERASYEIDIQRCGVSASRIWQQIDRMNTIGFVTAGSDITEFSERPNFMNKRNSVIYYTAQNTKFARELAKFLSSKGNPSFFADRGEGIGIPKEKIDTLIIVQFVGQSCIY
ncbi:MAG: hypothetical protein KJZ64_07005 [Sphingomonadaceae bacterium]|nr:hypothetical protein [Sphingomonadaceae bacterium]